MMKIIEKIVSTILLSIPVISTAVAAPQIPAGTTLSQEQHIKLNFAGSEISSLDPVESADIVSGWVNTNLFETLVRTHANSKGIVFANAESYTVNDQNTVFIFKLRPQAKWSNGDKVTAHDYVFAWQRLANPKNGALSSSHLINMNLLNAQEVITGKLPLEKLGVKALDDYTLEVTTSSPTPWLLEIVSNPFLAPAPKKHIESTGLFFDKKKMSIVSNGPFILSQYGINDRLEVVRNKEYWNSDKVIIDKVTYTMISDANILYLMFLSKEVDRIYPRPATEKDLISKGYTIEKVPTYNTFAVQVNMASDKTQDINVRRALQYSINPEQVVKVGAPDNQATSVFLPPHISGGQLVKQTDYFGKNNKAKALESVAKTSYTDKKPLELTMVYPSFAKTLAVIYKAQIEENTNKAVIVNLEGMEWKTYLDRLATGNYDIGYKVNLPHYDHATSVLEQFRSNSGNNNAFFKSEEYDNLYNKALLESDTTKAAKLYAELNQILIDQVVEIPVMYGVVNNATNPKLLGGAPGVFFTYNEDYYFVK